MMLVKSPSAECSRNENMGGYFIGRQKLRLGDVKKYVMEKGVE